ncbi:MAG: hypothetical protein SVJ22_08045 [Halobacteriota archaeon]|nr:hypothetical protein [Halobacteriota archaeon]
MGKKTSTDGISVPEQLKEGDFKLIKPRDQTKVPAERGRQGQNNYPGGDVSFQKDIAEDKYHTRVEKSDRTSIELESIIAEEISCDIDDSYIATFVDTEIDKYVDRELPDRLGKLKAGKEGRFMFSIIDNSEENPDDGNNIVFSIYSKQEPWKEESKRSQIIKRLVEYSIVKNKKEGAVMIDRLFIDMAQKRHMQNEAFVRYNELKTESYGFSDDIVSRAEQIIETTEIPLFYIIETIQRRHIGDPAIIALDWLAPLSMFVKGMKQLHVYTIGRSGSGKSSGARKTRWVFPQNWFIVIDSLSPKSVYYAQRAGELRDDFNILYINEVEDNPDAWNLLNTLTDTEEDTPAHWTVVDGKFVNIEIKGKRVCICNSVKAPPKQSLNSRFIHTNPDQSDEHTEKVTIFLRDRGARGVLKTPPEEEFEVAQCVTKLIGEERSDAPLAVVSPLLYLYDFSGFSPRNLEFFISLLAVVTYTNRRHRRIINGKIISTEIDFDLTLTLWTAIQKYQVTHLPEDAHTILDSLPLHEEGIEGATLASIQEAVGMHKSSIRRFLFGDDRNDEKLGLLDLGLVEGRKKPNTDGGVVKTSPWEFWRKADSCCPQLTPNLDRANLTEQDIMRALNEDKKLVPESQERECKIFFSDILREIKNITPSYLEIRNKYFEH